jgi:lysozyme
VNLDRFRDQLELHEGLRLFPYTDSTGHVSVGIGRNLSDKGISREEAYVLLSDDMRSTATECLSFPWWDNLNDVRQRVIADMCFNLGLTGLRKFVRMLLAVEEGRYADAAKFMLRSKWATQVGNRAARLSRMMETGEDYTD